MLQCFIAGVLSGFEGQQKKSEVDKIKLAFEAQKVQFETLMETGDLAITDADLVTCGIQELGVRKVILSLIGIKNKRS